MATEKEILHIDKFDPTQFKWKRWLQQLEGAFVISKIEGEARLPYLLHFIGTKNFSTLCDYMDDADLYTQKYTDVTDKLKDLFEPEVIEIAENFKFNSRKQQPGENIHDFVTSLKKMSQSCNFGTFLKTALRNQFVFGIASSRVRQRLLETKDLTLDKAIQIASSMELSEKENTELNERNNNNRNSVHAVGLRGNTASKPKYSNKNKKFSNKKTSEYNNQEKQKQLNQRSGRRSDRVCYRCGSTEHLAPACSLPKHTRCNTCGVQGHLSKICFKNKNNTANEIEELLQVEHPELREKFFLTVKVNTVMLEFEVDSGAAVTLMAKEEARRYFKGTKIHKTEVQLITFCKRQVSVLGYITVNVTHENRNFELNIYLTDVARKPLMGREWIRPLLSVDNTNLFSSLSEIKEVDTVQKFDENIQELLKKYDKITKNDLSKIENLQANLVLKKDAKPVFARARTVPFKLLPLLNKELDFLEKENIIEKIETSECATPVVPILKKDNSVRVCGDFSITVNPQLIIDDYHLPTVDELFADLAGCTVFCKLDLRQAYLQLELNDESTKFLVLNTHRGLYKCKRLWYGVASAVGIWQRTMESIFASIPKLKILIDDMIIGGTDKKALLETLDKVFEILNKYNIKINVDKCKFLDTEIIYCGFKIDKYGLHKMNEKIKAIENMPRPKNQSEVRAFIGFINYYNRFIQNASTLMKPLYELLQNDKKFAWSEECENTFIKMKKEFQSEKCLIFYNPKLPLIVATDASPYGCGAVLSHQLSDGTEKPIKFISHAFSKTEAKYSQIDKEAFAIIFAIKKFHQYLYGAKFTLVSDQRALVQIFSKTKPLPVFSAMRMQHYAIFLQAYNYEIKYKRSEDNSNADGLSRLPILENENNEESSDKIDIFANDVLNELPVTAKEILEESKKDTKMAKVIGMLRLGKKFRCKDVWNCNINDFCLVNDILMKGHQVVIPETLKNRVLQELHVGHFGIVKMKNLARGYCWWPNLQNDLEELARNCFECNMNKNNPVKENKHIWEPTDTPFERIHVDFAGPFYGKWFFVMVDAYSKWPEIHIVKNITAGTIIEKCQEIFGTFGLPKFMVSDNGSTFTSAQFKSFLQKNNIQLKLTAPYNPSTNGQAERFVQILKQGIKKLMSESGSIENALRTLLERYRITPHTETAKAPAELMFNRKIRCRLDLLKENTKNLDVKNHNKENVKNFAAGERVIARNYIGTQKWKFGSIKQRIGTLHYLIKLDDGRVWKRHLNQINRAGEKTWMQNLDSEDTFDYFIEPDEQICAKQKKKTKPKDLNLNVQYSPRKLRDRTTLTPPIRYLKREN